MARFHSFVPLFFSIFADAIIARHLYPNQAEAAHRRQLGPITPTLNPLTQTIIPTGTTLTWITPSPGLAPIPITEQSQLVTSFAPQYTLCELDPLEPPDVTPIPLGRRVVAPYLNLSIPVQIQDVPLPTSIDDDTCTTIYSATETIVCATVLSGLATQYTVSSCNQQITFSTDYGFSFLTPTPTLTPNISLPFGATSGRPAPITPAPSVETLTTYYLAPWQELTAGTAPTDIRLKVCHSLPSAPSSSFPNDDDDDNDDDSFSPSSPPADEEECIVSYEVWHTTLLRLSTTYTSTVDFSTTLYGSSRLIIETYTAEITDVLTTFSLSTVLTFATSTEFEAVQRYPVTGTVTGPTSYTTVTVQPVWSSVNLDRVDEDFTTTIHITSTSTVTSTTTVYPVATEVASAVVKRL